MLEGFKATAKSRLARLSYFVPLFLSESDLNRKWPETQLRHPFHFSQRRSSLPVMQPGMRLLSLFLLCVINGPAVVWSQDKADNTPLGSPGLPRQPDAPAADVAPFADVSPSAVFLRGYRAFHNKDWKAARTAFEYGQQNGPLLADYHLYFLGQLHRAVSRPLEAQAAFERLLDEYPTTVWRSDAALALARLSFAAGRWKRTLAYVQQAQQAPLVTDTVRQQGSLLMAQAYEQQGRRSLAYQHYQALRTRAARTDVGKTAKAGVAALRKQYPEDFSLQTAQAYDDEIKLLVQEEDAEAAQLLTEQLQARFSTSSLRPASLLLLAGLYKNQGQRAAAIAQWREVVERYPHTPFAPKALYRWARFFWNQDEDDAALLLFKRLTKAYPRHALAAEAWNALGRIFQSKHDQANATAAYQHLRQQFSRTPLAREAHWRQGWMAYGQGEYRTAQKIFQKLAQAAPGTTEGGQALYWQARAAGRLGQSEEAARVYRRLLRRYPHGYYALWAEKHLGTALTALPRTTRPAFSAPRLSAVQDAHYARYTTLVDLRLLGLARRELDFVRRRAPRGPAWTRFLLSAYQRVNDYPSVFRLLPRLNVRGTAKQVYLYPQAYWALVRTHAEKNGLEPYLILALIRQESLFDAAAVSPADAYGLMQLLPTTAATLTHLPLNGGRALTDPAFNIRLGTSYLRGLLERYQGSLILALSAYNAGEKAADKWLARFGELEPDEFIEHISYGETRRYVKLILRNYRTYVRLYASGAPLAALHLP